MPKYPGKHYKSAYWTFECQNKHRHRVDIDYEFQNKEWTIDIDGWKFLTDKDGNWIDTVPTKPEEKIKCSVINHSEYPKTGKDKKSFSEWDWEWLEKFRKHFNLDREIGLRSDLQNFYSYRAFGCRGIQATSLKDMLGGCKGYKPVTDKTCDLCLKEYENINKKVKNHGKNKT
jgi:hypothetical protein